MLPGSERWTCTAENGYCILHQTLKPINYLSVPSLDEPKTGVAFRVEDPNPYLGIRVSGNARVVGAPFTFGI